MWCDFSSILSSLLITPVFQDPIDSVQDMLNSPSELIMPGGGSTRILFNTDPRPGVQILSKRVKEKPLTSRGFEKKVMERFVHVPHMYRAIHPASSKLLKMMFCEIIRLIG